MFSCSFSSVWEVLSSDTLTSQISYFFHSALPNAGCKTHKRQRLQFKVSLRHGGSGFKRATPLQLGFILYVNHFIASLYAIFDITKLFNHTWVAWDPHQLYKCQHEVALRWATGGYHIAKATLNNGSFQ